MVSVEEGDDGAIGPEIPTSISRTVEVSVTEVVEAEETLEPEAKRMKIVETEEITETFVVPVAAPKPVKTLQFEDTFLRTLPRASQYEKSFMHRDAVTHVFATKTDFIITASCDGHLKFWKKIHKEGVEFVKHFRCHMHPFSDICINYNGTLMATVCTQENTVKVFDIINFDMINMFKFPFSPKIAAWIHLGSDLVHALAISDANSPKIFVYDGKGENAPIHMIEDLHTRPVALMEYVPSLNVTISIDERGMMEYWSGPKTNYQFPNTVKWEYKTDTDLFEFAKNSSTSKSFGCKSNRKFFCNIFS
jgi:peptidylprolyl isomerase domain and WD repeat-containing protein 1